MTPEDEESVDKTTITVKFKAYPYKIANKPKIYTFTVPANLPEGADGVVKTVVNNSGHKITPTFITDVGVTLKMGNVSYFIPAGETADGSLKLDVGQNTLIIQSEEDCTLTVKFFEEVF